MKKITLTLFFVLIVVTVFSNTSLLTKIAKDSRNDEGPAIEGEIVLFEDESVMDIVQFLSDEFLKKMNKYDYLPLLTIVDSNENVIFQTVEHVVNVEDFTDMQKEGQFKLIIFFVKEEMIPEMARSVNLEEIYQRIKDKRYYVKFADLFVNHFPTYHKVDLLHEDLLWNIYIDGVKTEDETSLMLNPGYHTISCPQLVMYNTDKPFKHYNILIKEQEETQFFYLPEKQIAEFEFILNKDSDYLQGKRLNILTINYIPIGDRRVFKEEKLFDGAISDNKAEITLDKGIQYDNLLSIKTSIKDAEKEIFKKLYPMQSTKKAVQFYDSFAFLQNKQQYEIMIGEDNSVSIMDSEWYTQVIPYTARETTLKTGEDFEKEFRKLEIVSNQKDVTLYLNDTYIGRTPMTLWISKTQSYVIETVYKDISRTVDIIPVTEREKIEFNF